MSVGNYALEGGFWPGVLVVPILGGPTLFIQLAGSQVIISWSPATPGFVLEQASDLSAPVRAAAPVGNPVTIPLSSSAYFYRLRKP